MREAVDCDIDVACGVVDVNRVASVAERGIVAANCCYNLIQ